VGEDATFEQDEHGILWINVDAESDRC